MTGPVWEPYDPWQWQPRYEGVPIEEPDEPLDLFEPAPPAAAPPAGNDYAKQTVPELKALLKARGLKVGGKKADLVDRLAEADAVPN